MLKLLLIRPHCHTATVPYCQYFTLIYLFEGPPNNSPVSSGSEVETSSFLIFQMMLYFPLLYVSIYQLGFAVEILLNDLNDIKTKFLPLYSKLHYLFNVNHWKKRLIIMLLFCAELIYNLWMEFLIYFFQILNRR